MCTGFMTPPAAFPELVLDLAGLLAALPIMAAMADSEPPEARRLGTARSAALPLPLCDGLLDDLPVVDPTADAAIPDFTGFDTRLLWLCDDPGTGRTATRDDDPVEDAA